MFDITITIPGLLVLTTVGLIALIAAVRFHRK